MEASLIIIGAIVIIALAIAFYKWGQSYPEFFSGLLSFLECCSMIGVFGVTLVITVSTFLVWHSLLLAALVGASVMTMLFLVLSAAAASYKAEGQS